MRRWNGLVDEYLAMCEARGLASATVEQRRRELERWGSWLRRRRPRPRLEEVDAQLVIAYVRSRTAFRSKATVATTMSVMRAMGGFLVERGFWGSNPLRWLRGPKLDARMRVPRRIGAEAMRGLWAAASEHRSLYQRHLWTTVLAVLYGTGLRRGELERLEVASWQREAGVIEVDGRKTGRVRRVPVPGLAEQCLERYLPQRHNQLERRGRLFETALFVNQRGERLRGGALSQGVARLSRRAGLERVPLHAFRHSCASDLLEAGVHLPEVMQWLGHRCVSTTMRYLQIADPQRHAAMERHPINDWLAGEAA